MRIFAGIGFVWIAVIIAGMIGWVMNLLSLIKMLGDPVVTPLFIARLVGVPIAPLGAILGWF